MLLTILIPTTVSPLFLNIENDFEFNAALQENHFKTE